MTDSCGGWKRVRMEERDGGVYVQSEVAFTDARHTHGAGWMIQTFLCRHPEGVAHVHAASDAQSSGRASHPSLIRGCALASPRRRRKLSASSVPQKLPDGSGVAVPGPLQRCSCGGLPHAGAPFGLLVKRAIHRAECFGVVRVAEDEAIHAIVEKGRYACKNRGYDRQAAGHRSATACRKNPPGWTDVQVSSGVGVENIRLAGSQKHRRKTCRRGPIRGTLKWDRRQR